MKPKSTQTQKYFYLHSDSLRKATNSHNLYLVLLMYAITKAEVANKKAPVLPLNDPRRKTAIAYQATTARSNSSYKGFAITNLFSFKRLISIFS